MKKNAIAKLNSGHQKLLQAIWNQKRREIIESKALKANQQSSQPVLLADKSNLKLRH
jgi:hypothetical protein